MSPLKLTDDQMSQVLRSAEPLRPSARSAFLRDVAQALNGHELGDGAVMRACREAQKRHFGSTSISRSARAGAAHPGSSEY
jgi:hypothetical protein